MLVDEFDFQTCIHEPCLYYKTDEDNNLMLIVRQVDDILLCHKSTEECDKMANKLQKKLTFPLNFLGTVQKFNGVDVDQTKHFNDIHCWTFIDKVVTHHQWENEPCRTPPTPFQADN